MKGIGSKFIGILVLVMILSGCKKEYDDSFSMWLVFGSRDSSTFSSPVKIEIYEEDGNAAFASLAELHNKRNIFTSTDPRKIDNVLASLRAKADGPLSIRDIIKTVHVIAYQGTMVGYVKYSIVSENGGEIGFAMPIQSETSSVLGNVAFIKWLNQQNTDLENGKQ